MSLRFVGFFFGDLNFFVVGEKEVDMLREVEMRDREKKIYLYLIVFFFDFLDYYNFFLVNFFCD